MSLTVRKIASSLLFLALTSACLAQQEWAYHHPEHIDHSHILVDSNWGTERVIAAVSHYDLGLGSSGATTNTPQGSSIIIRQKEDGTLLWEKEYFSNYLLRISDMKVVPGTSGQTIAAVGHIRLSMTGTFSDRAIMIMIDAGTGVLLDYYMLSSANPQIPLDSRLLGLDFYMYENQMHIACVGWTGDVTSTSGAHKGLYLRSLIGPSGFSLLGALDFDSNNGGSDCDFLGKVVNDGSGMLVIGSTNQYAVNGQNEQGALVARIKYNGNYDWGRSYWEAVGTGQDDGVVAADILAIPNQPLILALNHLKNQRMSISTLDPTSGFTQSSYSVDVTLPDSQMEIIKAFDLEATDGQNFILGGYLHEHPWTDASGTAQLGNIPFRLGGSLQDQGMIFDDLIAFRVPSKGAGETVNNWAYAPFPQDRWQPYVYHPEMFTLEAGNDPNIDLLLTGYRERTFSPNRFDLDIIPTNYGGTFGPCEAVSITEVITPEGIPYFDIPDPVPTSLSLLGDSLGISSIALDALDCGQLSTPLCSLPDFIATTINCLDVDFEALNGTTIPADVHYTWDFGDGSAPLTGTNLNNPPIHSYGSPGTYSVELETYCIWDPSTTVNANTTVTVEDCGTPPCDVGAIGMDMWLYCGEGCWGGMTGTRAAITFDMALFALSEADYDAEVCFSDGTTMPLNLDMPMSIIKCFSGFTFFKKACLKIYEEGELASGGSGCLYR